MSKNRQLPTGGGGSGQDRGWERPVGLGRGAFSEKEGTQGGSGGNAGGSQKVNRRYKTGPLGLFLVGEVFWRKAE